MFDGCEIVKLLKWKVGIENTANGNGVSFKIYSHILQKKKKFYAGRKWFIGLFVKGICCKNCKGHIFF